MNKQLNSDEYILACLKRKISETNICKKILKLKKETEKKEIDEYYLERWENIAGVHYMLHDTHLGKFSHIWDETSYIIIKDHKSLFYDRTGISYQVIELIHELIKKSHDKEWFKYDDNLYSILANKIMIEMKRR